MVVTNIAATLFFLALSGRWQEFNSFIAVVPSLLSHETNLSPTDQASLDRAFDLATGIKAKEETARAEPGV